MKLIFVMTIPFATALALAAPVDPMGPEVLTVSFQLQGVESFDAAGDASNTTLDQFLGAGSRVIGVQWEGVELRTVGNSFLNEASIGLNSQVSLRVGATDNFSGIGFYDSAGMIDLISAGLDYVLDDGMLDIEFFETTDDAPDQVDALYAAGKFTVHYIPVPSPSSAAMLACAGLLAARRRRY